MRRDSKRAMTRHWGLLVASPILLSLIIPTIAEATTPYPRLLFKAEAEPDFDIDAAVEMVDDGSGGDDVAQDGLFTAQVLFPDDGGAEGASRTFHYRVIPPDTPPEDAIGSATGEHLFVRLPDGTERTVRFFYSTARATEIPITTECPDVDTLLSCLGFAPIPGLADDWNASGVATAIGDHQTVLGESAWDVAGTVTRLLDDTDAGRLKASFISGQGFGGSDAWQPIFESMEGSWRLGPDGWHTSEEGIPFDLEAEPWRVVLFEALPQRGMARQTVDSGPLPKLLLTEIVTDTSAPFVEIHNPGDHPLALSGLHLTNHPGYPLLGTSPTAVDEVGFLAAFPHGELAEPGAWLTISLLDATVFEGAWGASPNYVFPGRTGAIALEPSHSTPEALGSAPALDEDGGFVALIHHLAPSERILDVDIVTWGSPGPERALPDKSDMTAGSETYGQDSMRASTSPAPHGPFMARRDFTEGGQRMGSGFNGLFEPQAGISHDETDEPLDQTWALTPMPTPGEPPSDFRLVINGVVTDADSGNPVAGATVSAHPDGPTTTTAADGSYSLEVDAGSWTIEVSADGYQPGSQDVSVDDDTTLDIEIEREPGVVIGGRVRDDLDRWVAGARVNLVGGQRSRSMTTGSDGTFTFTGVQPNTLYTITASMDGYRSDSRDLQIGQSDLFDILLTIVYVPVSYSVSGLVLDGATDDPVSGATVAIPSLDATTISNLQGEFTFRLVPPATYVITARADGFAEQALEITVEDSDLTNVEIRLGRDGDALSLRGTITVAGLEMPITGAIVRIVNSEGVERETTTDQRGVYGFLGLFPDRYELTVTAGGYAPHQETIELEASTEHDVALEMPPGQGFSLSGVVRLEGRADDNLLGTTVSLAHPDSPDSLLAEEHGDINGNYRFENLTPGMYRLMASHEDFVPAGLTLAVSANTVQHFILYPKQQTEEPPLLGCDCSISSPGAAFFASILTFLLLLLGRHNRQRRARDRISA